MLDSNSHLCWLNRSVQLHEVLMMPNTCHWVSLLWRTQHAFFSHSSPMFFHVRRSFRPSAQAAFCLVKFPVQRWHHGGQHAVEAASLNHTRFWLLAPGCWKSVCVCGMGVFSREPHTRLSHPVNLQIRECTLLCALSNWPWWHLPRKLFSKAHHSSYPRALSFLSFLFKGFFFSTTAYILPQDSSSGWYTYTTELSLSNHNYEL